MVRDNLIFPPLAPVNTGLLGPAAINIELDQEIRQIHIEDLLGKISAGIESWCLPENKSVAKAIFDPQADASLFQVVAPFNIRTSFRCSTFGTDPDEVEARAELALSLTQEKVIEREAWSGPFSSNEDINETWAENPYLLDENIEVISGVYSAAVGAAVLEQAYADKSHGLLPTLYAPRSVASQLRLRSSDPLVTKIGTPVVAGTGFNAVAGKSGAKLSDNQALLVISGPTVVLLADPVITPDTESQAVNAQKNHIIYYAERQAVAYTLGGAKYATVIDVTK